MSWINSLIGVAGKVGGLASRYANRSGLVGKIASGITKSAGLITKYAPQVINIGKSVGQFVRDTGVLKNTRFDKSQQNVANLRVPAKQQIMPRKQPSSPMPIPSTNATLSSTVIKKPASQGKIIM